MKMRNIFVVLAAVLFLSVAAMAQTAVDVSKLPTIQVTGTAEIQVVPDEANFSLRVRKSAKILAAAKMQNDEGIKKILDLTKRFGIAPADVKTDYISVSEKYDRVKQKGDDEYTSVFSGYTVSKTVIVKLRNIAKFEEFFSAVVDAGVSDVSNVSFESSELRKYKDQARAMAIRTAKEKAEAIAREIGQTIGKAVSIEEHSSEELPVYNYKPNASANISSNSYSRSDSNDDTFAVGTISVKASVEVNFLLN